MYWNLATARSRWGTPNTPGKRVVSSAREVAGRCGVTLTQKWVSEAHEGSEMNERKLVHWACCCGRPVFGFRGVFTEVLFTAAVEAAQQLMEDQELALLMFSGPVNIRDLWPGSFGGPGAGAADVLGSGQHP
jgi:hypothetical protein